MVLCRPFAVLRVIVVGACLIVAVGCGNGLKRLYPTKVDATAAAKAAMTMYDTDGDGTISGAELDACPSLKLVAKDGPITSETIAKRINDWQISKVGRSPVGIAVAHNGKAMSDVSVRLVPEKFLTDVIPATGRTDANGKTDVSVPILSAAAAGEPRGVMLGFYRVEITKAGENIPAKYNTDTTLGLVVNPVEMGVTYNLVY